MDAGHQQAGTRMRVVTTVHKAGFDLYGQRFIEGMKLWPEHEFQMYAEGFDYPGAKRNEDLPRLEAIKQRHANYLAPNWKWDVLRFANKVFACHDAFYDHKGLGVWIDCDTVTYNRIPEGYIESMLPEGNYLGMFKRTGMHTETGFWVVDCSHEYHKEFFDYWLDIYETGAFRMLSQWHDCETMDKSVRKFEADGKIKTISLSQGHEKDMHPMAKSDIGRYIDHCKGNRKASGFSPENVYRSQA
jgi:hypothetical protein